MLGIAGEIKMNSSAPFSHGLLHMDTPVLADQQKPYINQLCADTQYRLEDLLDIWFLTGHISYMDIKTGCILVSKSKQTW